MKLNKVTKYALWTIVLFGGGLLFGYGIANAGLLKTFLPPKADMSSIYIVYTIFAFFLVLVVHELGHLLTGLFQGFSFELFVVFFLGIKRDEKRRIRPYFNTNLAMFGGVAATLPTVVDETTLDKFARVVIAGPISSVLLSVVTFSILPFSSQPWTFILFVTGAMSILIFFAVTIPAKSGLFYTDRKRYQRIKSVGIVPKIELALMRANALKMSTGHIDDMDPEELALITQDESAGFRYVGYYYLLDYHRADSNQVAIIRSEMTALESELPASFVKSMKKEIEKLTRDSGTTDNQ